MQGVRGTKYPDEKSKSQARPGRMNPQWVPGGAWLVLFPVGDRLLLGINTNPKFRSCGAISGITAELNADWGKKTAHLLGEPLDRQKCARSKASDDDAYECMREEGNAGDGVLLPYLGLQEIGHCR